MKFCCTVFLFYFCLYLRISKQKVYFFKDVQYRMFKMYWMPNCMPTTLNFILENERDWEERVLI